MGYASYVLHDGRDAGYAVVAICDKSGCVAEIDRGLGYLCGDSPSVWGPASGGEEDCGLYFCGDHLYLGNRCKECLDLADAGDDD